MRKITQAVILAGGAGTRLQPFTLKNPKPMVPVNGKPFLEHLINLLKENGIKEVVILTGYFGEKISKYFKGGEKLGIKIRYSHMPFLNDREDENQSGLRIKTAEKLLKDFFLLLYCDNYWPLKLVPHIRYFKDHPSDALVTVFSNLDNSTKNNTFVNDSGYVQKYDKSRTGKDLNGVEIGYMIISKKILDLISVKNSKFEDIIFPKLIAKKRLSGFLTDQKYYSIGDMNRVKTTEKFLARKKIVLLDRDGVINKKPPEADYVKNWKEFEFLPKAIEAIKLLTESGYKIFIISNQAGIGRKIMTEGDLKKIHQKMVQAIKRGGGSIEDIYYCPHNWNDNCDCRKPKPGMLYQASREYLFDITKAIFIGDDIRDKYAGIAAGCKTILIKKNQSLYQVVNLMLYSSSLK